jgi:Zn-dependent protease with chaperone function
MRSSRRSQVLLFGLAIVAAANGVLLGLFLYALLAFFLHLIGDNAPGIGWGLLAGSIGGAALLRRAERQAEETQERHHFETRLNPLIPTEARLLDRLDQLTAKTSLPEAPRLVKVEGRLPNAWAVSRRSGPVIVVTMGLLERLGPTEQEAVIAHELAHVEAEDLETVGLADAIAVSMEDLALAKSDFFWSPARILLELIPFLGAWALIIVLVTIEPKGSTDWVTILVLSLLSLGSLCLLVAMAVVSWRGLVQAAILIFFLGPLTVVEWLLAPPTAYALSRFVSRERILAADERAIELTDDVDAAIAALERLEDGEYERGEDFWVKIRYSLFVTQRARRGLEGWRERLFSTHPSIATRIARLREAQERSRLEATSHPAAKTLEQSG